MHNFRFALASSLLAAALAGCGGADAPAPADALSGAGPLAGKRTGPTPPKAPSSLDGLQASPRLKSQPQALGDGGYSVDTASREQVRLFYKTVFASTAGVATGWNGSIAGCTPGTTSAEHKSAVLRRINFYRAMAGVPASVTFDANFSAKAQQAALLMAANNQLNHNPPANWTCFAQLPTGAEAASNSNLALGTTGVDSISSYVEDAGDNNHAVGHRRWLLYPQTQTMGTGDVQGAKLANALWVFDANIAGARPAVRDQFVAWPPKGYVPHDVVHPRWSLSYPNANFSAATVTMLRNGTPIGTTKEPVTDGYGENTIAWVPAGITDGESWPKPVADTVYTVQVSNVSGPAVPTSFSYTVTVFDADTAGSGDGPISIAGNSTLSAGTPGNFSFAAAPGATSYQWRTLSTAPFTLTDGAEAGSGNFTSTKSVEYGLITTDVSANGTHSYHFAHTQPVDQLLELNQLLAAGPSATLHFMSRLGLSSPVQHAQVEVSADEGASWTTVYDQAGQQSGTTNDFGEETFTQKSISLAAYANRTLRIRWRYALLPGAGFYPQSSSGIGWYIDDIHTTGMTAATAAAPSEVASPAFTFSGSAGEVLLQARAGMYGYFSDWGLTKAVTVTSVSQADCLFNWAEAQLPDILGPHTTSQTFAPFYYRFYPPLGLYLGISSDDNKVYYYYNGVLYDLGAKSGWFATAGCQ